MSIIDPHTENDIVAVIRDLRGELVLSLEQCDAVLKQENPQDFEKLTLSVDVLKRKIGYYKQALQGQNQVPEEKENLLLQTGTEVIKSAREIRGKAKEARTVSKEQTEGLKKSPPKE